MMFVPVIVAAATAFAQLASGHFTLAYPQWRADTMDPSNTNYSQWNYPCGGVGDNAGNRTDWPLTGGAVAIKLHHPWSYVYINAGLSIGGINVTNFNLTLTPDLTNVTGKGDFCLPNLNVPMDIPDGAQGAIQVVTNGEDGADMYNCADITFRANAKTPDGVCTNDTHISAVIVDQSTAAANQTAMATATVTATTRPKSAAGTVEAYGTTLAFVVSLASVVLAGLGF
ncbi:hypothetical protein GGR52DRAFT_573975 [Hypoxylon sp. FL1284]|nr:hypothetical protein GGR52DRAFT_573975 [Hypoxylon sp. FL1284]